MVRILHLPYLSALTKRDARLYTGTDVFLRLPRLVSLFCESYMSSVEFVLQGTNLEGIEV